MNGLTFGRWLKQRRKALDSQQQALAERVGCTVATIRKIEADKLRPSRQLAERLAGELRIAPDERFTFLQFARGLLDGPDLDALSFAPALPASAALSFPTPPLPLAPVIGRDDDLRTLQRMLRSPSVRIVTLTGPPGVGKSSLGLLAAADARAAFAHGVALVATPDPRRPERLLPLIAQAAGIGDLGPRPALDALAQSLSDKQILLLLDDFDHAAGSAPQLAALMSRTERPKVVVTSRAALRIAGEHVFAVAPLALPDLRRPMASGRLAQYAAIELFVQRAQAAERTFTLDEANAPIIAEICARLDGLPLALDLAAARTPVLTPAALLRRLDRRLQILTRGASDAPARHRSLRAALDWSYDLLSAEQRRLFRGLGVFAGGCSLEAVAGALAWPGDHPALFDHLAALVDHSLLGAEADADGEPRFRMLETIREYALDWLDGEGELAAAQARHAAYYGALAESQARDGSEQRDWIDRLAAERGNLRAALAWLRADGRPSDQGMRAALAEALEGAPGAADDAPRHSLRRPGNPAGLSAREVEVLRLSTQGLSNAQVAERLAVSPRTVDSHLNHIYDKLGVSSRSAVIRFAIEHNLA